MLTGTWMDAPVWKEIKNAGPSAMGFRNAHRDMDGCTCLERNKKMQVCQPWHSGMLTRTWMDAPGWKEIKKCRSVGAGTQVSAPGQTKIKIVGPLALALYAKKLLWKHIYAVNITMDPTVWSLLWALPQQRNFLFWSWNAINYYSVMVCAEDPKDSHYTLTFTNRRR